MKNSWVHSDVLPEIHFAGVVCRDVGQPFRKSCHRHQEAFVLSLLCEGRAQFMVGQQAEFTVVPGTLVVIKPGVEREVISYPELPYRILYVGFSVTGAASLVLDKLLGLDSFRVEVVQSQLSTLELSFDRMVYEFNHQQIESAFIAGHLLGAVLGELARMSRLPRMAPPDGHWTSQVVDGVKVFVQTHYADPIRLKDLAQEVHLSPYHLSRLFKGQTGLSPMHFVQQYRMEMAKRHLRLSDETITAIAGLVGYESATAFQDAFKRIVGISPGQYRRMQAGWFEGSIS